MLTIGLFFPQLALAWSAKAASTNGNPQAFGEIGTFVTIAAIAIATLALIGMAVMRQKIAQEQQHEKSKAEDLRNKQLQAVFDNSTSAIVVKDAEGRYLMVNKTFANWLQMEPAAFNGKTPHAVLPGPEAEKFAARDREVIRTLVPIAREDERHFNSGPVRHTYSQTSPIITEDGTVEGIVAVVADITARVEAEAALRVEKERAETYLQIAETIIVELDSTGHIVRINPRGCELMGYGEEELVGQSWFQVAIPTEINDAVFGAFRQIINGDIEPIKHYENDIIAKSGKKIRVFWNNSLIKDSDGTITGTLSSGQDITARVVAESRLRQAQKMEAVGQLTGGVAHDFNNILNIMIGNAEFLRDELADNPSALHNADAIIKAVDRASALTSRLLAFSRQQTLSPQVSSIAELIGEIDDMLRRTLGATIDISMEAPPDVWQVLIDPHQFESALLNLSLNARDAMPQGGKLAIVASNVVLDDAYSTQHEDVRPGDYVRISVSDTGTGMSDEIRRQAIEPFYTTKDVGKGSGLGLSMVYGFTKQSGGHITIDSDVGQGTTIHLYLPRHTDEAERPSNDQRPKADQPDSRQQLDSGRILLVEDDENVRAIPAKILREYGYEIVEAGNGKEALSALRDHPSFDLLFTDIILPDGMNGTEIAQEAKCIQPDIKVLYTTGYSDSILFNHAAESEAPATLKKPYRREELLEKIRGILDADAI